MIGVNLQNVQNDPRNWVEPRFFHPERFLPADDPRYEKRFDADDKEAFKPFSVGNRNCMGGKLVSSVGPLYSRLRLTVDYRVFLAEARIILSRMMWNFDFELGDPDNWDWLDQKAYLVFEPKALMVKMKEKSGA